MLENIPSQSIMMELLGQSLYKVWQTLCSSIDEKYDMEQLWNTGGKNMPYILSFMQWEHFLNREIAIYNTEHMFGFVESRVWLETNTMWMKRFMKN